MRTHQPTTVALDACFIFGFARLTENNYVTIITKKKMVASIHGHHIYTIAETLLLSVTYRPKTYKPSANELRYKNILQQTDLTKGFYFSLTYDLTNTMQQNFLLNELFNDDRVHTRPVRDMFVWNTFASKPLLSTQDVTIDDSHLWTVPVLHGFVKQKTFQLSTGQTMKYCLIARRSRMFAGTRYLRRGVNIDGYVANEVESEQIFTREGTKFGQLDRSSSLVQLRGSIPLFWSNTSFSSFKPDIKLEDSDPTCIATKAHLKHMIYRYGQHVTFLSLIRQKESKPKEGLLATALMTAFCRFSEPAPAPKKELIPKHSSYSKARFLSQVDDDGDKVGKLNTNEKEVMIQNAS